jgi:hypothetical protein
VRANDRKDAADNTRCHVSWKIASPPDNNRQSLYPTTARHVKIFASFPAGKKPTVTTSENADARGFEKWLEIFATFCRGAHL